ncbi:MAG TPA: PQQ-dependent sugar dehydrogenase [Thermoanaerobaculia bacterium]|jgi:glucose/arabinose dehydrogenase
MIRSLAVVAALLLATVATAAEITLEQVAAGLDDPVAIAHAGDNRLFIVEQPGRIRIFDGTRLLSSPFLDIGSLVRSGGEQGLLGLAFHPRYAQNGFFYIDYTDVNGDTVIARYSVSATNPNVADRSSATILLHIDQPYPNHNGGQVAFGPDGYLYIGMGDGGSGGDPGNRAQNLGELLGKVLRIDVDSPNSAYAIPPSNPFRNTSGARPEIWAYGLRNPWRFSFDRATGDLWLADVGQGLWEEVDFQPATSIGGENYGWRRMEGTHCYQSATCSSAGVVAPVIEYGHDVGCSVTGGYVYRGFRSPRLTGHYIYGDYCSGTIFAATRNSTTGAVTTRVLLDTPFPISTFGEDLYGELFVADYSHGLLYRVVGPPASGPRRRAVRH